MQIGSTGSIGRMAPSQSMRDRMFARIDSNGDGTLSLDEFKAGAPKGDAVKGTPPTTTAQDDEMFAAFDTDGDGALSKQEMDAGVDSMGKRLKAAIAQHANGDSTSLVDMLFGNQEASSDTSRSSSDDPAADATDRPLQQRQLQWMLDAFVSQQKVAALPAGAS